MLLDTIGLSLHDVDFHYTSGCCFAPVGHDSIESMVETTYTRLHLLGSAVCLTGVLVNVLVDYKSDWLQDTDDPYPDKLIGDIFAFRGAVMIGVIHVFSDVIITNSGPIEYLGAVGIFAFPIAAVQSLLLERTDIANLFKGNECSSRVSSLLLVASVMATSLAFSGTAGFLFVSEAALLNLSLLTTDLWSASFSVLAEGIVPPPSFWVALAVILIGVFIYEISHSPVAHDHRLIFSSEDVNKEENLRPEHTNFEMT